MNKVIVKLYVPTIEAQYDIWLPVQKKISSIIFLLTKAIYESTEGTYSPNKKTSLYNKNTARKYDYDLTIKDTDIRNGSEIILI